MANASPNKPTRATSTDKMILIFIVKNHSQHRSRKEGNTYQLKYPGRLK